MGGGSLGFSCGGGGSLGFYGMGVSQGLLFFLIEKSKTENLTGTGAECTTALHRAFEFEFEFAEASAMSSST